ncbi:FKBP-type peptidyl-prolyl cis-trans isomerase [Raoultibacter phocaeensis]|uniref:FKBP-type peptidyl-prolyl cis-trans isomerase n=1 Tax=Raoultibacter phocaeensis TaxID=2479841 RepID=UPI00111900D5|nr:peptidylprolyl isomerase [Raoultibacter phocaeensis]
MVRYGETAVVRYRGTLADGSVFDSTEGIDPLEFVVGSGSVIHGFDEAVASMEVGETKCVTVSAREAYGEYCDEHIERSPMYAIPNAKDIQVGKLFYFVTEEGMRFPATVREINEGIATIDFNHPLAGKDLIFEIELVAIKSAE